MRTSARSAIPLSVCPPASAQWWPGASFASDDCADSRSMITLRTGPVPDYIRATASAIPGLYSHYITPSILATARPSASLIDKHKLVDAFLSSNLRTLINLQEPAEHPSCGPDGVLPDTGFSYDPVTFTDAGIRFFNFGWPDMTAPPFELMDTIVEVIADSIKGGRRCAVHCHAGLGRTGLAVACFLVTLRVRVDDAVWWVRMARPGSVQTAKQVRFLYSWAERWEARAKERREKEEERRRRIAEASADGPEESTDEEEADHEVHPVLRREISGPLLERVNSLHEPLVVPAFDALDDGEDGEDAGGSPVRTLLPPAGTDRPAEPGQPSTPHPDEASPM
ncbi:protein-tyrosine phosphatase-like protein [Hyaloraphidium curvatum]|nr:protein-tyrosine phosphatase-like protein [Hyaloraphidium curvatum]